MPTGACAPSVHTCSKNGKVKMATCNASVQRVVTCLKTIMHMNNDMNTDSSMRSVGEYAAIANCRQLGKKLVPKAAAEKMCIYTYTYGGYAHVCTCVLYT